MNLRAVPSGEGSRGGFDSRTVHDDHGGTPGGEPRQEATYRYDPESGEWIIDAGRQAAPGGTVAYHHAPRRFRASILRHGIDWQRSGENHSLDYCRGNYLWSNLAVALDDLESVDDEPRDVWRIDVSGFVLLPDPEQVWERAKGYWDGPQSAWLTIEPIAPNRITLLDRQEARFAPEGEDSPATSESTLAFDVGIDYDEHMICPWCGEADPGETSGFTTCCAESVIGPAEVQLTKGAK